MIWPPESGEMSYDITVSVVVQGSAEPEGKKVIHHHTTLSDIITKLHG